MFDPNSGYVFHRANVFYFKTIKNISLFENNRPVCINTCHFLFVIGRYVHFTLHAFDQFYFIQFLWGSSKLYYQTLYKKSTFRLFSIAARHFTTKCIFTFQHFDIDVLVLCFRRLPYAASPKSTKCRRVNHTLNSTPIFLHLIICKRTYTFCSIHVFSSAFGRCQYLANLKLRK